jgi:hypothetical protein
LTFCRQTRRSYELRTTAARRNYHLIKHVQRPLQLLHPSTLGRFGPDGLVRTESQSPEPSARSNLGEIPPSLSLQQLFPISSSSSLQGPDVSKSALNCQVTSCLPVTRPRSAAAVQNCHFRSGAAGSDASQNGSYRPRNPRLRKVLDQDAGKSLFG